MRWSWGTADGLVVISDAVREYLEQRVGIDRGQAKVIPYGLPLSFRHGETFLRRELGLTTEPLLLNVGRLVPQKGQLHLIDAMPEVLRHLPRCHLAIVGHAEDGYAAALERRILERGLAANVHLTGYREMGTAAMAEADVFVFPSLWEGFGLAVIEAMQAGVPVVCSDAGPLREIVVDGHTGVLVPPGDPHALAAGVLKVLESPDLAASLSAAAQRRTEDLFDVDRMVDQTHRYYLEALGGTGVAA
jgi:glycosyltransferase involved in cell wall biosynthesis